MFAGPTAQYAQGTPAHMFGAQAVLRRCPPTVRFSASFGLQVALVFWHGFNADSLDVWTIWLSGVAKMAPQSLLCDEAGHKCYQRLRTTRSNNDTTTYQNLFSLYVNADPGVEQMLDASKIWGQLKGATLKVWTFSLCPTAGGMQEYFPQRVGSCTCATLHSFFKRMQLLLRPHLTAALLRL